LWANGTTYASDGRFKKNIEPLQESLEKVLQLQGVSYEMKTAEFPNQYFNAGQQVGLIAQEVEKIVPEVVSENPDGYKAIDYSKLVPLLIESIKAQQAMLLKQQAEIDALKKKRKNK
jgi:IMP dehydrogenase/GMP reductase